MKKKLYIYSIIFFLIDFISKQIIIKKEALLPKEIIPNFFKIDKVTNTGAAFSILDGHIIIFILIALFVLIYLYKYLSNKALTKLETISYSLLIGGILGNLLDRIIYQKVIDFLSFKIINYNFPVFNLADSFIVISIILILIIEIGGNHENRKRKWK